MHYVEAKDRKIELVASVSRPSGSYSKVVMITARTVEHFCCVAIFTKKIVPKIRRATATEIRVFRARISYWQWKCGAANNCTTWYLWRQKTLHERKSAENK